MGACQSSCRSCSGGLFFQPPTLVSATTAEEAGDGNIFRYLGKRPALWYDGDGDGSRFGLVCRASRGFLRGGCCGPSESCLAIDHYVCAGWSQVCQHLTTLPAMPTSMAVWGVDVGGLFRVECIQPGLDTLRPTIHLPLVTSRRMPSPSLPSLLWLLHRVASPTGLSLHVPAAYAPSVEQPSGQGFWMMTGSLTGPGWQH